MKQQLLSWGIVLLLFACSTPKQLSLDSIFSSHFDHKMISSGANYPDFNTRKDSVDLFLISLHEGYTKEEFKRKAAWEDKALQEQIAFLISKQWLTTTTSKDLYPTVFIANSEQGKSLFSYSLPIALQITKSIEDQLHSIKLKYKQLSIAKEYSFETMSFLILSNVFLDNWQINNVESDFLNVPHRPERHGKNYYYALFQNESYPKEAFGIYGNQYKKVNDSLTIAVYGNNRNLVSKQLNNDVFVEDLVKNVPSINSDDNKQFTLMANNFSPRLIEILETNLDYSKHVYRTMGYAKAISFEEFYIWWYHFIYTQTTNMLKENGLLVVPEKGNFYYTIRN
jgi:hypothetical protein